MENNLFDAADDLVMQMEEAEQRRAVECLARCARAGADPDAVEELAKMLGVAKHYDQVRP